MRGDRPTEAQNKARMRNWHIRRLRGLWHQAAILPRDAASQVQAIIDNELKANGAEPEFERRTKHASEQDIPF